MRVIVTGATGYIGGETVLKLLDDGHSVLGIDRVMPSTYLINSGAKWLIEDFSSNSCLDNIRTFAPDAIIHCAGTSLVGPSMTNPTEYYDNNFVKTKCMLDYILNNNIETRIIFSSSAATYGNPIMNPCQEVDPCEPISPYGESKLMIDWMLQSYHRAYGLDYVSFRYFNACGADSQVRHGQESGATHIIARVLESIKNNTRFTLYGVDYPTPDGTCIRDYIHVEDLANAHIQAIDKKIPSDIYNLGTNQGHSNLEVIAMATNVTQTTVIYENDLKREGDPAVLTADPGKFEQISGWKAKYGLEDIIRHAWAWYNR